MSYIIRKTEAEVLFLNSKEWETAEEISISNTNWDIPQKTNNTKAWLLYNDKGIYAKFSTDESPLILNHKEHGSDVFKDSAVELFIAPNSNDANYFNFEINAAGYAIIGLGPNRARCRFKDIDFEQFNIKSEIKDDGFDLIFFVPFDFLKKHTSEITKDMKGNMQKCCEEEGYAHFMSAFPIFTEKPDFHAPKYFKEFTLE